MGERTSPISRYQLDEPHVTGRKIAVPYIYERVEGMGGLPPTSPADWSSTFSTSTPGCEAAETTPRKSSSAGRSRAKWQQTSEMRLKLSVQRTASHLNRCAQVCWDSSATKTPTRTFVSASDITGITDCSNTKWQPVLERSSTNTFERCVSGTK